MSTDAGVKLDADKVPMWDVMQRFSNALTRLGEHTAKGDAKYTPGGWLAVPNAESRYRNAMMRHVLAVMHGEVIDEDGNNHMDAILWNTMVLVELRERRRIQVSQLSEKLAATIVAMKKAGKVDIDILWDESITGSKAS